MHRNDIEYSRAVVRHTAEMINSYLFILIALFAAVGGSAGQRVSLKFTGVTIPSSYVTILRPDGTTLGAKSLVTTAELRDRFGTARNLDGFAQLAAANDQPRVSLCLAGAARRVRGKASARCATLREVRGNPFEK